MFKRYFMKVFDTKMKNTNALKVWRCRLSSRYETKRVSGAESFGSDPVHVKMCPL